MKYLAFICFLSFSLQLSQVREMYPQAADDKEVAKQLFDGLSSVTNQEKAILIAYKGAATTLMAKYSPKIKDKKELFKTGVGFMEHAITKDPTNIEIRLIRLSIQENSPKFLKYKSQIETDKAFILENYGNTRSKAVRTMIKNYAMRSKVFDPTEKQLF